MDYKSDLLEAADDAQSASSPQEILAVATRLYAIARFMDMRATLDEARRRRPVTLHTIH